MCNKFTCKNYKKKLIKNKKMLSKKKIKEHSMFFFFESRRNLTINTFEGLPEISFFSVFLDFYFHVDVIKIYLRI